MLNMAVSTYSYSYSAYISMHINLEIRSYSVTLCFRSNEELLLRLSLLVGIQKSNKV